MFANISCNFITVLSINELNSVNEPCIMVSVLSVIILSHNFIGNNFLINVKAFHCLFTVQ